MLFCEAYGISTVVAPNHKEAISNWRRDAGKKREFKWMTVYPASKADTVRTMRKNGWTGGSHDFIATLNAV